MAIGRVCADVPGLHALAVSISPDDGKFIYLHAAQLIKHVLGLVHLLARDNGDRDVIPKSIQLIAGRTGQEFNQRKSRNGAYWEDRYHATAVETDKHLIQCLIYIDLNMVRAGVVEHPSEWGFGGYNEIQAPRERYALIDYDGLRALLNFSAMYELAAAYCGWIEESLKKGSHYRDERWTESIAVGSEAFVMATKEKLGFRAKGREVIGGDGSYELKESPAPYSGILGHENVVLRLQNIFGRVLLRYQNDGLVRPGAGGRGG